MHRALRKTRVPRALAVFLVSALGLFALVLVEGLALAQDKDAGFPPIVFNPKRPIPAPPGDVRDINSLVKPPPGYTMTKRNNFYKKGTDGKTLPGTDLYRWAWKERAAK